MRTFKFTLLAVLSYVAMIGATPLGNRASAKAIDRRQKYASLATLRGGSDPIENISPAQTTLRIPTFCRPTLIFASCFRAYIALPDIACFDIPRV